MKQIAKDEIFKNLSRFLKGKGIELTDGSYAAGIQQSCSLLTDAINLGQKGLKKARTEIQRTCENMKRVVHEKTAPKPPIIPSAKTKSGKAAGPQARTTRKKNSR